MEKKYNVEYELFNKFSIDALEALETILSYSDKNHELYGVIGSVLQKKYEEAKDDYEGMNEYDTITRMLNFNLSEIKSNVDSMSEEELYILRDILDTSITKISPEAITDSIIPIIKENKDAVDSKLPDDLSEKEIEGLLKKCTILELDALYSISKSAEDIDKTKLYNVANKLYRDMGFKRWQYFLVPVDQISSGILSLSGNIVKFNLRELNFLAPLVDNSSFYVTNNYNSENFEEEAMLENLIRLKNLIYDEIDYIENNTKTKTLGRN